MSASNSEGLGKGPKSFEKLFFKVYQNTYVGAAVKIGIVDRTTTTIAWWTPPSRRICKRRGDVVGWYPGPVMSLYARDLDEGKYRLDLEIDGGSGGC